MSDKPYLYATHSTVDVLRVAHPLFLCAIIFYRARGEMYNHRVASEVIVLRLELEDPPPGKKLNRTLLSTGVLIQVRYGGVSLRDGYGTEPLLLVMRFDLFVHKHRNYLGP
jgi:hypothetical protein